MGLCVSGIGEGDALRERGAIPVAIGRGRGEALPVIGSSLFDGAGERLPILFAILTNADIIPVRGWVLSHSEAA